MVQNPVMVGRRHQREAVEGLAEELPKELPEEPEEESAAGVEEGLGEEPVEGPTDKLADLSLATQATRCLTRS